MICEDVGTKGRLEDCEVSGSEETGVTMQKGAGSTLSNCRFLSSVDEGIGRRVTRLNLQLNPVAATLVTGCEFPTTLHSFPMWASAWPPLFPPPSPPPSPAAPSIRWERLSGARQTP